MMPRLRWPEGLDAASFCHRYWQREAFYIAQAFNPVTPPLDRHQLAQLACEYGVDARLISGGYADNNWQLKSGPFTPAYFQTLPEKAWTLLVCGVDTWVPEAADLLGQFRFMPDYRIDDLMVSFAVPGGSVGPHVDQYDVFLIQAEGLHRWQIASPTGDDPDCVADLPIQILKSFAPAQEWTLEPGDMLYLPPGVPHYGVALEPGMTLSVGFRAPAQDELLARVCRFLVAGANSQRRARDAQPVFSHEPACLTKTALQPMRTLLRQVLDDESRLQHALAAALSCSGAYYPDDSQAPTDWLERLRDGGQLRRSPEMRGVYLREGDWACLYIEGEEIRMPLALAQLACDSPAHREAHSCTGRRFLLNYDSLQPWLQSPDDRARLDTLIAFGFLEWADDIPESIRQD